MNHHYETEPGISRRNFLRIAGAGVAAVAMGRYVLGSREPAVNLPIPQSLGGDELSRELNSSASVFNPEVYLRPRSDSETGPGCCADAAEEQSREPIDIARELYRNAPVFTLVHSVSEGENLSMIISRYYAADSDADQDTASRTAESAFFAANRIDNPGIVHPGQELYVPISSPVVVERDGQEITELAETYGFSEASLSIINQHLNDDELTHLHDYVYLPMQNIRAEEENRSNYVVESDGPATYYSIASSLGVNLSALIALNRPQPDRLEVGHVLTYNPADVIIEGASLQQETDEPDITEQRISTGETLESDQTPEYLRSLRQWEGQIPDLRGAEVEELEQRITSAQLREIDISNEGYNEWLSQVDVQSLRSIFEEVVSRPLIDNPNYFIIHHTAQLYPGTGHVNMSNMTSSMNNTRVSVQWGIARGGGTFRLTTDPLIKCIHALSLNEVSTGVEIATDGTHAQGSLENRQLEEAVYLAYHVLTDVYGKEPTIENVNEIIVGHREINDRLGVGRAKPDFYKEAMDVFRQRLMDLVNVLNP